MGEDQKSKVKGPKSQSRWYSNLKDADFGFDRVASILMRWWDVVLCHLGAFSL